MLFEISFRCFNDEIDGISLGSGNLSETVLSCQIGSFKGHLLNIFDTIYLAGTHWHVFTTILCEKCADLVVFIGTCVIRSDPFETRSDHFR